MTKPYICRLVDVEKPDGLWEYVSPEGEVSSPVTRAFAEKRCAEYNVLIKAGNKLVDYSTIQAMYLENNRTLYTLLKNLVDNIDLEYCPEELRGSVPEALEEAKCYLERNRPG